MKKRFLIVIWLTGGCNLNCRYCYASENHAHENMSFETAKKVIERLRGKPLKIQFSGGEPLLNFVLAKRICAYVRDNNIDAVFQLQTNGTLINPQIAGELKTLIISVGVSLDGAPDINELTRGKSVEAVNGIRCLAAENMTIGLNAVVTSKNVNKLGGLVDFAYYLGNVGGIGLDLLRKAGSARAAYDELSVTTEQLRAGLISMSERADEMYRLTGKRIEIRELSKARQRLSGKVKTNDYCYASCGRSLVVLPNGEIYPCGSLLSNEYRIGNADNFDYMNITPLMCGKSLECNGCKYETICSGGCPSRKIRNENELDCVLMKTAFELAEEKYADLN